MSSDQYIEHITLPGDIRERLYVSDFEPVELGSAYERTIYPINAGLETTIFRGTGYTARGRVGAKSSLLFVYDEGVAVAALGVCLHSRSSLTIYDEIRRECGLSESDAGVPPSAPWSALVHLAPGVSRHPRIEQWGTTVAASMLLHKDLLGTST